MFMFYVPTFFKGSVQDRNRVEHTRFASFKIHFPRNQIKYVEVVEVYDRFGGQHKWKQDFVRET